MVLLKSFLLFFLLSTSFTIHGAFNAAPWMKSIKWPKDRVQDQVNLLPFAQEFKLNFFLQKIADQEGLDIFFHFTPSLEGKDLQDQVDLVLQKNLEKRGSQSGLIFFLSLSDRKFKIHSTGELRDKISDEDLKYFVKTVIPHLTQQHYSGAISTFLSNFLFRIKGKSQYKVPELKLHKTYNLNSLLFFIVGAFLIFMLGHKIRRSPKVIAKDASLVKKKHADLAIFW